MPPTRWTLAAPHSWKHPHAVVHSIRGLEIHFKCTARFYNYKLNVNHPISVRWSAQGFDKLNKCNDCRNPCPAEKKHEQSRTNFSS